MIRRIFLYLFENSDIEVLTHQAAQLSKAYGAHITAVYIKHAAHMPNSIVGRGASSIYLDESIRLQEEKAKLAQELYEVTCKNLNLKCNLMEVDLNSGESWELLNKYNFLADLALIAKFPHETAFEDRFYYSPHEKVLLSADYPFLYLPFNTENKSAEQDKESSKIETFPTEFNNILVAFKAESACFHAIKRALPLLEKAKKCTFFASDLKTDMIKDLTKRTIEYLEDHHISVTLIEDEEHYRSGAPMAQRILEEAENQKAELIVVGAYGSSTLKNIFMGSTTEQLLRLSPLPLLIAN